jgi:hypothetical protein
VAGERLFKAAAHRFPPLWIAGGDHNNLSNFPQFYEYLEAFLAALRRPRSACLLTAPNQNSAT